MKQQARVIYALGRRAVLQTFRRPQLIAPLIVFPTLLLAIQTGGAGSAVDLPGFPPVDNFLSFMLAGAMIQSTMLAGNAAGIALAVDIEMGFTDRLLAAPIPRYAIVLGRLAGAAALGAFSALWFLAIGLIFGVSIAEGIPGVVVMILVTTASALAFGSVGAAIALRSGSASVVQGMFPLVFVILFLSTAFFPQELLLEPAGSIAEYNPASFIVNVVRDPVISAFSSEDIWKGLAGIVGVGAIGSYLSARGLSRRLRMG